MNTVSGTSEELRRKDRGLRGYSTMRKGDLELLLEGKPVTEEATVRNQVCVGSPDRLSWYVRNVRLEKQVLLPSYTVQSGCRGAENCTR